MNVVVCVKAVANSLVNDISGASELAINPYDLYALKIMLDKKKQYDWHIDCLCMGPSAAREILIHCLALGADRGIHLCDPRYAGSDTYATAYTLSKAIEHLESDIVVCGQKSVDGETGQVPGELAVHLGGVCISNITDCGIGESERLFVQYECGSDICKAYTLIQPLILSFKDYCCNTDIDLFSLKRAKRQKIDIWDADYLKINNNACGQIGSKTKVTCVSQISHEVKRNVSFISENADAAASFILNNVKLIRIG